jgi:hypothetical protein
MSSAAGVAMDIDFLSLPKFVDGLIPGIIGGLVGGFLAHRLNLWRDKRKEFNEIAQPIRELLLQKRNAYSPNTLGLTAVKADQLEAVLPWWRRHDFHSTFNAYKRYKETAKSSTSSQR